MNFVQICFSFKGRISRTTYWLMQLLLVVISVITVAADADYSDFSPYALTWIVITWCALAVAAKRWHDRNKSAWWILIALIPIIGGIWTFVELGFFRGTTGKNRFGLDPLQLR